MLESILLNVHLNIQLHDKAIICQRRLNEVFSSWKQELKTVNTEQRRDSSSVNIVYQLDAEVFLNVTLKYSK